MKSLEESVVINIDLKKEQQASLARPRRKYSLAAKLFFLSMDSMNATI